MNAMSEPGRPSGPMNIGQAAAAAGVTPKMVRHYESLGLMPAADRTDAGYRLYTAREVEMLRFIRQSRALGFSMQQIESLLALWRDEHRESRRVKELAKLQLAELDERQKELDRMRTTLAGLLDKCAGDQGSCCPILDRLSAPAPIAVPAKAASTLKQVKPGSSAPRTSRPKERTVPPSAPVLPAHAGLAAWSRSFRAAGAAGAR